jgi:Fe-S oxidoreductase
MEEQGGQRINYLRSQEAVDTGADALVSACPFCLQMFDEGVKAVAPDGRMQTLDLAELLEQALAPAPSSSD